MKRIDYQVEDVEPDFEPLSEQFGTGDGGKIVLAAVGAGLGAAAPAISVPIAAGVAALDALRERVHKQQKRRQGTVLQAASERADTSPEDVVRRITEDDTYALLAAEALDAAARTRLDSKVASLGRSLGALLQDDALIDRESIWIRILSVIESPHIRVLRYFVSGKKLGNDGTYWTPGTEVSVQTVSEGIGLEDAVLPLVQDLLRCGLLMRPGGIDGGTPDSVYTPDALNEELRATQLGAELFVRLELAAEEF
ncbi:hypothetical protein DFO47_103504 [Arthrobacter sp. AG258]|uniref:hypothetical protein n=1 Tax=Arthrobacter sp. AG258 TaxID=2183899 RepID=UPI00105DB3E6|nr:hypothetical protein [Arthrobacter sp. AG258]TDT81846.1 hypothetical protein DFO47_103504 [Arthrobacter sp. AG258]